MKRALLGIVLIAVGFALGFYTATSSFTNREETQSVEVRQKLASLDHLEHVNKKLGTLDFLRAELSNTEAKYAKAPTPELRRWIDFDLKPQIERLELLLRTPAGQ